FFCIYRRHVAKKLIGHYYILWTDEFRQLRISRIRHPPPDPFFKPRFDPQLSIFPIEHRPHFLLADAIKNWRVYEIIGFWRIQERPICTHRVRHDDRGRQAAPKPFIGKQEGSPNILSKNTYFRDQSQNRFTHNSLAQQIESSVMGIRLTYQLTIDWG